MTCRRSGDKPTFGTNLNIILTGIPRSGTTLTCSLLNKLPQTIALHEPMNPGSLVGLGRPTEYLDRIGEFFAEQRRSLLVSGQAISKAKEGGIPDNNFGTSLTSSGLRKSIIAEAVVHFEKPLASDFRLIIKHPNFFTATLADLLSRYPCFAVVRNPLSVLQSWNSVQESINDGHAPFAEAFNPALKAALALEPDRFSRQLRILSWYFEQYEHHLTDRNILRYEEIVSSKGRSLELVSPAAVTLDEPLVSLNRNRLYAADAISHLAERLLASSGSYWNFYTKESVEQLLVSETAC